MKNAIINAIVSLKGTEHTATTDSNGMFTFENVPPAAYTLTISSPDILTITKEITLSQGQSLEINLPIATVSTGQSVWDVNGDNKLGLEDIIYGLQILSGVR